MSEAITKDTIRAKLLGLYDAAELAKIGQKTLRKDLCKAFGLEAGGLDEHKDTVTAAALEIVSEGWRAGFFFPPWNSLDHDSQRCRSCGR